MVQMRCRGGAGVDAEVVQRRCRGAGIRDQGCRDAGMQGCRDAGAHRCRGAEAEAGAGAVVPKA